jgi:hypothetical protein
VIENCHLHHGHVRGALLKSPEATVRNCTIEHTHRHGIVLYAGQFWLEGPFPDGIRIVNNVLKDCGFASLTESASITTTSAFGVPRGSIAHADNIRDIVISGNRIVDPPGVAIKLVNADGVLVRNNTIIDPLSGSDRQETLDFSRGIPSNELTDVMSNPRCGIVTISSRNVHGWGNRAEKHPRRVARNGRRRRVVGERNH